MAIRQAVWAGVAATLFGSAVSSGALAAPERRHAAATPRTETARLAPRHARTRIEIYGSRAPLHRDCRAVFDERWIPAWGGRVLYAGQDCWWAR